MWRIKPLFRLAALFLWMLPRLAKRSIMLTTLGRNFSASVLSFSSRRFFVVTILQTTLFVLTDALEGRLVMCHIFRKSFENEWVMFPMIVVLLFWAGKGKTILNIEGKIFKKNIFINFKVRHGIGK
jgi:hypothetical protein